MQSTPQAVQGPVVAGQPEIVIDGNLRPGMPLTRSQVGNLRERRSMLSDQLQSATGRRNDLVQEMRSLPAEARIGVQKRIDLLDERILQLESDIASTGRLLTSAPALPGGTLVPPIPNNPFVGSVRDLTGLLVVAAVFIPLSIAFTRRLWRRGTATVAAPDPMNDERLQRLEQAVDAIAIEVERVGEAQRYYGKLMSESRALGAGQAPAEPLRVPEREPVRVTTPSS